MDASNALTFATSLNLINQILLGMSDLLNRHLIESENKTYEEVTKSLMDDIESGE